jgi:hypothetical protein
MESDFFAILTSHAPLTALIPATRITPVQYTQATGNPCLRYTKIDGITGLHMQGSDGLSSTLMQIDVRGLSFGSVLAVRNVLVGSHGEGGLLHPYRGVKGATQFQLIQLRSDRGVQFEKPGSVEYYTTSLDFDVWSKAA